MTTKHPWEAKTSKIKNLAVGILSDPTQSQTNINFCSGFR